MLDSLSVFLSHSYHDVHRMRISSKRCNHISPYHRNTTDFKSKNRFDLCMLNLFRSNFSQHKSASHESDHRPNNFHKDRFGPGSLRTVFWLFRCHEFLVRKMKPESSYFVPHQSDKNDKLKLKLLCVVNCLFHFEP